MIKELERSKEPLFLERPREEACKPAAQSGLLPGNLKSSV